MTSFRFKNKEHLTTLITSRIVLHIENINDSSAVLYFTDNTNNKIDIDVKIYENKFIMPKSEIYNLFWTKNYRIQYEKTTLNIRPQRVWEIT